MSAVLETQIRGAFQDAWVEAFRGIAGIAGIGIIQQFAPAKSEGAALPRTRPELSI